MRETKKAAASTVNYSQEQEAALIAASPISYEDAGNFADAFGKPIKSIIAKIHSLNSQEGIEIEYIPKAKPAKRPKGKTKSDLVSEIEAQLGAGGMLKGLVKAPAADLSVLLTFLHKQESNG